MQIEMTIKGLMVDPITNMPIVILRDEAGEHVLPIWVGIFEANAIALQIENVTTPRPMTHDLLRNLISDLNGSVEKIVVCDLKENTFYALIHVRVPGRDGGRRCPPERRDRTRPARERPDLRGGHRRQEREEPGLRSRQGRLRATGQVARESGPGRARQVQDVANAFRRHGCRPADIFRNLLFVRGPSRTSSRARRLDMPVGRF